MNIYRHKENKKSYIIEHLIKDIYRLNNNEFAGIYAIPYKWSGEIIKFNSKDEKLCTEFVKENFELIAK